jgi:hypothetical protein
MEVIGYRPAGGDRRPTRPSVPLFQREWLGSKSLHLLGMNHTLRISADVNLLCRERI